MTEYKNNENARCSSKSGQQLINLETLGWWTRLREAAEEGVGLENFSQDCLRAGYARATGMKGAKYRLSEDGCERIRSRLTQYSTDSNDQLVANDD